MRDKDWGGDWVIGEFKTASLTGSNFPGIVELSGMEDKGECEETGKIRDRSREIGDRVDGRVVQPRRGRVFVGRRR